MARRYNSVQRELEAALEITGALDGVDIMAAFVVGSCARLQPHPKSDIDLMVCLRRLQVPERRDAFLQKYFERHAALGRNPDRRYSGELPVHDQLMSAIDLAAHVRPTAMITDPRVYDGLVWAGMLDGPKIDLVSRSKEVPTLEEMAHEVVRRWVHDLGLRVDIAPDLALKEGTIFVCTHAS